MATTVGLYGITTIGNGLVFDYDFFTEVPPSPAADLVAVVSLLLMGAGVATVGTLAFGAYCVLALEGGAARTCFGSSALRLRRDAWWAIPAFALTAISVLLVLPGPLLVGWLAAAAGSRFFRTDLRSNVGGVGGSVFGQQVAIGLLPAAWALLVWLLAAVAAGLPSPTMPVSVVLVVLGVAVSTAVMAVTAAAIVELHLERARGAMRARRLSVPHIALGDPMHAQLPPPGWYPHGLGHRWWDGVAWGPTALPSTLPPPATGPDVETALPVLAHAGFFFLGVVLSLIFRLTEGRTNAYARHHSTEALNFQITFTLAWIVCSIPVLTMITFAPDGNPESAWVVGSVLAMLALFVIGAWMSVLGAIRAGQGVWWRYPVSIRFVRGAAPRAPA